jgi:uncharacterized protein (TIGR02246 family)
MGPRKGQCSMTHTVAVPRETGNGGGTPWERVGSIIIAIAVMVVGCFGVGLAAENKPVAAKGPPSQPIHQTADEKGVRESSLAFVEAFNKGDAKAMGSLWTADCEYVDETGRVFQGRDAIEKEYAAFFAAHPGLKVETTTSSLKMVGGSAAIEEGVSVVKGPDGVSLSRGLYTAMLVKEGDKWLMASVREHASPSLSVRPIFDDLDWLTGQWGAEQDGKPVNLTVKWVADKRFLEVTYTVGDKVQGERSGIQIIGREPSSGEITSWSFDSTGGHGRGQWLLLKKGWIIHSLGVMPDGAPTTSTDIVSKIDEEHLRWQSVNRHVAGKSLSDSQPVVLTRKPR